MYLLLDRDAENWYENDAIIKIVCNILADHVFSSERVVETRLVKNTRDLACIHRYSTNRKTVRETQTSSLSVPPLNYPSIMVARHTILLCRGGTNIIGIARYTHETNKYHQEDMFTHYKFCSFNNYNYFNRFV